MSHAKPLDGIQAATNDSDAETPDETGRDIDVQMPGDDDSVDEDHPPLEDLSQETLELGKGPGSGDSHDGDTMSDDQEEEFSPKGDSQRPDAWMSAAFMEVAKMDRAERTVVPVDVLYTWFVDGRPSLTDYCGTFSKRDVRYFDSNTSFFNIMNPSRTCHRLHFQSIALSL